MTNITLSETTPLTLPSDQEASGRTLGDEEIALVAEAIRSGTLTSTKGTFVKTCDMGEIMTLARARDIAVIEDCAQALGTRYDSLPVGTLGAVASFSLQQGKHVTTGEGGLVATNDSALARRMVLFINKAWGYGDPQPDHYFLALNYRMSELHGAVAVAQLPKLGAVVQSRIATAGRLTDRLRRLRGIDTPRVNPRSVHTYWKYCLQVDGGIVEGGAGEVGKRPKGRGHSSSPRHH